MMLKIDVSRPNVGTTCAFKPAAAPRLADIPGKVSAIWPRFRSGDYLVTLEYARPVKFGKEFITHIDAFVSELCCDDPRLPAVQRCADET